MSDTESPKESEDQFQHRLVAIRNAASAEVERAFKRVEQMLRLGSIAERALWCIHQAVIAAGTSLVSIPDTMLRTAVWGKNGSPRHWRSVLRDVMRGLRLLHIAEWSDDWCSDGFGPDSLLIAHFGDLRGDPLDVCDDACRGRELPAHHHYQIEVGPGFLGVLEQFGIKDDDGSRSYHLNQKQRRGKNRVTLASTGKSGRLVSVYLPARIGDPKACKRLNSAQRRLLQSLFREGTRAAKDSAAEDEPLEVTDSDRIRDFSGKGWASCPYLDETRTHVGFNGNRMRKGLGYRLCTLGGWLFKAGYALDHCNEFLDDLGKVAETLGLVVVGVDRNQAWFDLQRLKTLAASAAGFRILDQIHVRVHAESDFLSRWNQFFEWKTGVAATSKSPIARVTELAFKLKQHKISIRRFAQDCLHKDHSYVLRLFQRDETRWPAELLQVGHDWVDRQPLAATSVHAGRDHGNHKVQRRTTRPIAEIAIEYLQRGWAVLPQKSGAKCPCVKWKHYQDRLPTEQEVYDWYSNWPTAGIAVVLGPVSNLLVVDVDGREAHEAFLDRLSGEAPIAPKALSGSREPFRYHLYFQHPDLPTKAKSTPWHPKLEFRGHGGVLVMPPSIHKSGNAYVWSDGRSPDDLALPPVPSAILNSLRPSAAPFAQEAERVIERDRSTSGIDASNSTLRFLAGKYADGPDWNKRLFGAACDLHGRGVSRYKAEPLLLAGACPWNWGELESAKRTISSAYSAPRSTGVK